MAELMTQVVEIAQFVLISTQGNELIQKLIVLEKHIRRSGRDDVGRYCTKNIIMVKGLQKHPENRVKGNVGLSGALVEKACG